MDEAITGLSYEQSALPQAFVDLEGRFSSVNRALTDLLGHPASWWVGRDVVSVLHPMDSSELASRLDRLRSGETRTAEFEVVALHAEGRSLQLLVDLTVLLDPRGAPVGVALIGHDLTSVRTAEERLAGQERLYRALGHHAAEAAMLTDAGLLVTFVSPAATRLLRREPLDLLGVEVASLVHEQDRSALSELVDAALSARGGPERRVLRVASGADAWRWAELTIVDCLADPDVGGLILNLRDVTAELEAQQALRESEARHRAIVETAHEGIAVVDRDDGILLCNDRLVEILGLDKAELGDTGRLRRVLAGAVPALGEGRPGDVVRRSLRYAHPAGTERVLSVSSTPLPPERDGDEATLVMVSDMTEAHRLQERLRHQALHDQLTGLPNRYLFEDRLEMAVARQRRRPGVSTAVMFVDLDGFKEINDSYGHAVGDGVLVDVGRRLTMAVRAADTVARLGGDEFAIVCEGLDEAAARLVADRIQSDVFGGLEHEGMLLRVRASIGIALFPPHDPGRALALADTAMYEAKRLGSGGVTVYAGT